LGALRQFALNAFLVCGELKEEVKTMLVLSRKIGQRIVIGDNITIVVNRVAGNRVTLGIEAPEDVHIMRGELEHHQREFRDVDDADAPATIPFSIVDPLDAALPTDASIPIVPRLTR